jgi:hypothetical protein
MPKYYRMDNRNLSFRDCWYLTKNSGALVLWGAKILHIPMDFGTYLPEPANFPDLLIEERELTPECRLKAAPALRDLETMVFTRRFTIP